MVKGFAVLALIAASLYAAVLGWLWLRQESLLFIPTPLPPDHRFALGDDVRELQVKVPGATLSVLQLKRPDPKGVVFFLHGNAGNLEGWFSNAAFYRDANYDLVMPDYRGYGKSTGRVESEAQLRADVRAVWDQVAPQYAGRKLVVYGRSLGTALAADFARQLAAERHTADLLVLVTPYSSMGALVGEFYPWVPGALLRYPLDTTAHLREVKSPILLVHAAKDTLIREHHARRLHEVVPAAQLLVVPGAGHNDVHEFPVYRDAFRAALARL